MTCACRALQIYIMHVVYRERIHIISYHIISYHIISYHIISYHIISYHIISYHIQICTYIHKSYTTYSVSLVYSCMCAFADVDHRWRPHFVVTLFGTNDAKEQNWDSEAFQQDAAYRT